MYTDNYYTSIPAMHLYHYKLILKLPEPFKSKHAKEDDLVSCQRGPLLSCALEDRIHVILSTHSKGHCTE